MPAGFALIFRAMMGQMKEQTLQDAEILDSVLKVARDSSRMMWPKYRCRFKMCSHASSICAVPRSLGRPLLNVLGVHDLYSPICMGFLISLHSPLSPLINVLWSPWESHYVLLVRRHLMTWSLVFLVWPEPAFRTIYSYICSPPEVPYVCLSPAGAFGSVASCNSSVAFVFQSFVSFLSYSLFHTISTLCPTVF